MTPYKFHPITLLTIPSFTDKLLSSFDLLPEDPYLNSKFCYRKRRYSTGILQADHFTWLENELPFYQSTDINKYNGGVARYFAPISEQIRLDIEEILTTIHQFLPSRFYKVGIHQLRVIANELNLGHPAPEGIHQDGFDFLAIICVNSLNVKGGVSSIFLASDHKLVFETILLPNTLILLSDKHFSHYTSSIYPELPGIAKRDVIVTTFKYSKKG